MNKQLSILAVLLCTSACSGRGDDSEALSAPDSEGANGSVKTDREDQAAASEPSEGVPMSADDSEAAPFALGFELSNVAFPPSAGALGRCVISQANCELDTDTGDVSCLDGGFSYAQLEQGDTGLRAGVFVCDDVEISQGASLRVTGSLPLVLISRSDFAIAGELSANAARFVAVAGGAQAEGGSRKGGGAGGGSPARAPVGGGGGGYCEAGGRGGSVDDANSGGASYGGATLSPLIGGSAGGSNFYGGGAGGGALQLVAATRLRVLASGRVSAGGGGGGGNEGQGGGGGSGGAILLEAPVVSVAGTLSANGGAGGQGQGRAGGPDATSDSMPAPGAGGVGGNGSAAALASGGDAVAAQGGGGGAAGRIRIHTSSGVADVTGTLSPSLDSGCASQAELTPAK